MRWRWSAWLGVTTLAFAFVGAACARSIIDPANDPQTPSGGDDGSSTAPASSGDDGSTSGITPAPGDDAGSPASGDDSSTSSGNDAAPTTGDDSSASGDDSSATPDTSPAGAQGQAPCPDTTKYKDEYGHVNIFTATVCSNGSECSTSECCWTQPIFPFPPFCVAL